MARRKGPAITIGQRVEVRATATSRYSFTAQYIGGAALLAQRAEQIEAIPAPDEQARAEHRALVVGAIMQASAAIEAELAEVLQHGPGHHLGSNGIDKAAQAFLEPVADLVDRSPGVLERWRLLVHLLRKPTLDKGTRHYQEADLLIDLRNELVHYRSYWGGLTKTSKLLVRLREKKFARPPFVSKYSNDFPHAILGAACAKWACQTAANFLDDVYALLGVGGCWTGIVFPALRSKESCLPRQAPGDRLPSPGDTCARDSRSESRTCLRSLSSVKEMLGSSAISNQ